MPRLFTGFEIPSDVGQALSTLRGGLPGARWIDPENYHLTFALSATSTTTPRRKWRCCWPAFAARVSSPHFDGVTSFGGRKPRAVVAAVPPVQALLDVQAEQERLMRRIGLEPEGAIHAARDAGAVCASIELCGRRLSVGAGLFPHGAVQGLAVRAVFFAHRLAAGPMWSRRVIR